MRAWVVHQPGPVASGPPCLIERPVPEAGPGQMLLRIRCCGVCRTDLRLAGERVHGAAVLSTA